MVDEIADVAHEYPSCLWIGSDVTHMAAEHVLRAVGCPQVKISEGPENELVPNRE
jgi:hypothetical protein